MDPRSFDQLARRLSTEGGTRRGVGRTLAAGLVGALLHHPFPAGAAPTQAACVAPGDRCGDGERCCAGRCQGNRCRCPGNKQPCGRRCIPKDACCTDPDCGPNEQCLGGDCRPCLAQGTACSTDAECCTGICDAYTSKCQQVRVFCERDADCPGGRCCDAFGDRYCLYETATQRACEPEVSCGYLLCGDRCGDLSNDTYQYCGFDGPAACRRGRCCCPEGVPLADCLVNGAELPRCEK
jgi:hypothetical protein